MTTKTGELFEKLVWIMDMLRQKCPWDKKQDFQSIRTLTIEETYELSEAILSGNFDEIRKELGDLLFHVVFYSKLADEQHKFDINDVLKTIAEKLIYRHPHVFGNDKVSGPKEVEQNWEKLKLKEKNGNKSLLSGLPESLPSVIKAQRMQIKAAGVGFDWDNIDDTWKKVKEELLEFENEMKTSDKDKLEEEFGDLIFALINVARFKGINADTALEKANKKFIRRFNYIEQSLKRNGKSLTDSNLEEMDKLWNQAKSKGL